MTKPGYYVLGRRYCERSSAVLQATRVCAHFGRDTAVTKVERFATSLEFTARTKLDAPSKHTLDAATSPLCG